MPYADALNAQVAHLRLEARVGGYEAANRNLHLVQQAYAAIAALVGASTDEIAFMDSATRAWSCLLYSLTLRPGDVILSARSEFGTNLITLGHLAKRTGASVVLAECEPDGSISVDDVRDKLTERVALVAISHVPMQRGVVNPVTEIGQLVRAQGRAIYLLDACQSAGQVPIDVQEIGCHACTGTGRKWLRGPRGTGFLYVERDTAERINPAMVDADSAELRGNLENDYTIGLVDGARRFESWERSVAAFIGLGAAIRPYVRGDQLAVQRRIARNARVLRRGIAELGYLVHENTSSPVGIVTFQARDRTAVQMKEKLATEGFAVSAPHRCDAPVDFDDRQLESVVRVSPHAYNTAAEVSDFLQAMRAM